MSNPNQVPTTEQELRAQVEALKAENEAIRAGIKKRAPKGTMLAEGLSAQVSEKGAVSVYGLGRFPVTLFKSQWMQLLPVASHLIAFIKANEDKLAMKPIKNPQPPKAV